jgi:hypothetical protein
VSSDRGSDEPHTIRGAWIFLVELLCPFLRLKRKLERHIMMAALIAFGSAILGAILGAYLSKRWTPNPASQIASLRQELTALQGQIERFEKDRSSQKQDDDLWTAKFESVTSQIVKVGPSLMILSPEGNSHMPLYGLIFPNVETRTRVGTFLVEADSRYVTFSMRMLSAEFLRRPIVREVIDEALECLRVFREKHPNLAAQYLGSPR